MRIVVCTPLQYGEKLGLHTRALHAQNHLEGREVLENLLERRTTCPVTAARACLEKGACGEPALSLARQAREQRRPGPTGPYGTRYGALHGLTRQGRHLSRHGQLPLLTTGTAATEALAVDAIELTVYMRQRQILGLSSKSLRAQEALLDRVVSCTPGG